MRQDGLGVVIKEEQACLESVRVEACPLQTSFPNPQLASNLPLFASVLLFFFLKSHFQLIIQQRSSKYY